MSLILSQLEVDTFQQDYSDFFDTMSQFHNLVVYKKPQQQVINVNSNNSFFGYGSENTNPSNINYISNSGVFKCMVITPSQKAKDSLVEILPIYIQSSNKIIKVTEDVKNFIENDMENERIILDGIIYIKVSSSYIKNYGNLRYFYFGLNETT